jgi:hypothetical protein
MALDSYYGYQVLSNDPKKKYRRNLVRLGIVFGGVGVALALFQVNVLALIGLFTDIFAFATCVSLLILSWTTIFRDGHIRSRKNDSPQDIVYPSTSRVDSLSTYVRYAANGSEYSKKEIARTINKVLIQRFGTVRERWSKETLIFDREFLSDLAHFVFPFIYSEQYIDSGSPLSTNSDNAEPSQEFGGRQRKAKPHEREAYLTGIERIILKLERRR